MKVVRTKSFDQDMARIGATEEDIAALSGDLSANPEAGDRVIGLRGVRKVRFGLPSRNIGKRGGGRAIYLLVVREEVIFLIMAFAKNEQSDLSSRQRRQVLAFLEELGDGED